MIVHKENTIPSVTVCEHARDTDAAPSNNNNNNRRTTMNERTRVAKNNPRAINKHQFTDMQRLQAQVQASEQAWKTTASNSTQSHYKPSSTK